MIRDQRLAKTCCPVCRAQLDAASDPEGDATPKPGDYSVCAYCVAVLRFVVDPSDALSLACVSVGDDQIPPEMRDTVDMIRRAVRGTFTARRRNTN
jgi:hypothetical protein